MDQTLHPSTESRDDPKPEASATEAQGHGQVDRSNLKGVYPEAGAARRDLAPAPKPETQPDYRSTTSAGFSDLIALVLGVASSGGYVLIAYLVKKPWPTQGICLALAVAAIFFALKSYRNTDRLSPAAVVGLSAATIAVVSFMGVVSADVILRSALNDLQF